MYRTLSYKNPINIKLSYKPDDPTIANIESSLMDNVIHLKIMKVENL